MSIHVDLQHLEGFVADHEFCGIANQVKAAHEALHSGTGLGNDFIGWVDLPTNYDHEEFARIKQAAKKIKSDTDVFIVIGIGGSYLGARAAIEFLKSNNYNALKKHDHGEDDRSHHHDDRGTLELRERGPRHLVYKLVVRFFYVIEHTSVFYSLAGAERFELPSTVLETAILPLNYAPKKEAVR